VDAPEFVAPQFRQPTFAEAQQEPGYQFWLEGGADALERSAAARGVHRTGGTLKDIAEYGQNFASQEYGNVFNRALQSFDREYRGAWDQFTPRFDEWKLLSNAEQAAGLAEFSSIRRGGGGGGGADYATDLAAEPAEPGAPPGFFKPGTTDPDYVDWLRRQQQPPPAAMY
jgi:hypothetical protein